MRIAPGPAPLVLCGPSGAGKSTILKKLMSDFPSWFGFSVSHTTRQPRQGEEDGTAYHFVTKKEMEKAIDSKLFIEHATFAGNMYGTSKAAVATVQARGLICVLDIDIQGVRSLKKTDMNANYVFIKTPSLEVLRERLGARGTETEESLERRLAAARTDIAFGEEPGNFDVVVVNDKIDSAYGEVKAYIVEQYSNVMSAHNNGTGTSGEK